MWEGYYASEPFDLRLTCLRLLRNLGWIILFTALGTAVFGGGYYLKNVAFGEQPRYEQTITCKVEYTDPPTKSGDYYINEMTWNTYVHSGEFEQMVWSVEPFIYMDVDAYMWERMAGADIDDGESGSGLSGILSAKVESDIQVPSFTVSCLQKVQTEGLSQAVQNALTGPWAEYLPEIASIQIIDISRVEPVYPDARPTRAFILSAILSGFFVIVIFLLREIGADSIWLPATLGRRYGLKAVGTVNSPELAENLKYLFQDAKKTAVCAVNDEIDPVAVVEVLREKTKEITEWQAVPAPLLVQESVLILRQADAVLLVVPAGMHVGKPLEYVLEFLKTQDVTVTAALLWDADEALIRSYYLQYR